MFRFLDPLGRSRFSSWNLRDGVVNNVDISAIRCSSVPRWKKETRLEKDNKVRNKIIPFLET